MTALVCVRCGDASLTVEAAAEYVATHHRLPACACDERQKEYDRAQRRAYSHASAQLRKRHREEFARLYEESKQIVGLDQHRVRASEMAS